MGTPLLTDRALAMGLRSGKYRLADYGLEQRCTTCGEYWPADTEFFYPRGATRLASECKACFCETYGRNAAARSYRDHAC
jgi:hypothetical protein